MSNITSGAPSPGERQGTPLVLVADDEPSMLELVARHLKTMHDPKLEVIEASDGETAWRLAREHLPDLVVLDVMMPGMSGWEVCRKIREDVALAHTGVVMLTGIGENLNQMTSPLYGADAYIDKPFEFEELDEKVKTALESRAAQREGISRPLMNGVGGAAKAAKAKGTVKKASPKKKKAAPKAKAKPAKKAVKAKAKAPAAKRGAKKKAPAKKKGAKKRR
jgi:DNA-binding response OmpR family regulator